MRGVLIACLFVGLMGMQIKDRTEQFVISAESAIDIEPVGAHVRIVNNAVLDDSQNPIMLPRLVETVQAAALDHSVAHVSRVHGTTGAVSTLVRPPRVSSKAGRVDAYVLSGSGARITQGDGIASQAQKAFDSDVPALGICYGAQEMAVAAGGDVRECLAGPGNGVATLEFSQAAWYTGSVQSTTKISFADSFVLALTKRLNLLSQERGTEEDVKGQNPQVRAAFLHYDCAEFRPSDGWRPLWIRRRPITGGSELQSADQPESVLGLLETVLSTTISTVSQAESILRSEATGAAGTSAEAKTSPPSYYDISTAQEQSKNGVEEIVALAVHEEKPWVAAAFHPEAADSLEASIVTAAFLDAAIPRRKLP